MDTAQDIIVTQDHVTLELTEVNAVDRMEAQLRDACRSCESRGIYRLIIHMPHQLGPAVNNLNLFSMVTRLVQDWNRRIRVAVVASYPYGPLEEFAMLVARNRGITVNLYTNEAEALAWLNA